MNIYSHTSAWRQSRMRPPKFENMGKISKNYMVAAKKCVLFSICACHAAKNELLDRKVHFSGLVLLQSRRGLRLRVRADGQWTLVRSAFRPEEPRQAIRAILLHVGARKCVRCAALRSRSAGALCVERGLLTRARTSKPARR